MRKVFGVMIAGALCCMPVFAQQTGSLVGSVTGPDGEPLPGVTVEASSTVLPQARATTTSTTGEFRLPALPPGEYILEFTLEGMEVVTRDVRVFLDQANSVQVQMGMDEVAETIDVVAETPLIDKTSTAIKSALSNEVIELLPVGQEYQDLVKLIPGVQYSENEVRGPSAGASGQDNVYQFDGVNVTLPLFGTLAADPSSHDIDQIAVVKGGAKAVDFNRAGGFLIDSVSKSGTSRFTGLASYQIQTEGMTEERETGSEAEFEEDKDWATFSLGGPIVSERLFFYASYYQPTRERDNRANAYGEVPNFESERDEFFGKLTFTPTSKILLHGSYRDSGTDVTGADVGGEATAGTASTGNESTLEIAIAEGSWLIDDRSFATFKYTDFANETQSRPDTLLGFPIAIDGTVDLDVNNLERMGLFQVPVLDEDDPAFNEFARPLIERYGFIENGVRQGGGLVGAGTTFDNNDFFRESIQVGYDRVFGENITHDVHVGYQWYRDEEDVSRTTNGWGFIQAIGGRETFDGQPVFYEARFQQQTLAGGAVPPIHSEYESQNVEINDTIQWNDWSFNLGVMMSQDTLYGQGLREAPGTLSGFVASPGTKYEMHEIDWEDMISPRLGATWAYNGVDTVYASYAKYYPAASSLPRAASWDRNLRSEIEAFFDADGNLIGSAPLEASSGKLFQEGIEPRYIDEFMLGTSQQITSRWTGRAYARYRYGGNYWEDTNNDARIRFDPPPGIPQELYIPDLDEKRGQIGSGSSYVIAQLDGAFTKYYEVSLESEWRGSNTFLRGSYTWSHYYGNFDQDNTTRFIDDNIFIGSSFLADGTGRQLWNNKYGDLKGDRRHLVKLYGFYEFDWNGSAGIFGVYQSGEPWEMHDAMFYFNSTFDRNRFAEPAGSRQADDHYQIDLNYTHNFPFGDRYNVQAAIDIFNVTDNQTGFNIQPEVHQAGFGEPQDFFDPRRIQLAVRFQF